MQGTIGLGTLRIRLVAFVAAVALVATFLVAAMPARDANASSSVRLVRNTGNVQSCKSVVIIGKKKFSKNCSKRDQRTRSGDVRQVIRMR